MHTLNIPRGVLSKCNLASAHLCLFEHERFQAVLADLAYT